MVKQRSDFYGELFETRMLVVIPVVLVLAAWSLFLSVFNIYFVCLLICSYILIYCSIPILLYFQLIKRKWKREVSIVLFCVMSLPVFFSIGVMVLVVNHPSSIAERAFRRVIANPAGDLEIIHAERKRDGKEITRDQGELAALRIALNHAEILGTKFDLLKALELTGDRTICLQLSNGVVLELQTMLSEKYPDKIVLSRRQFEDEPNYYYLVHLPAEIALRFQKAK